MVSRALAFYGGEKSARDGREDACKLWRTIVDEGNRHAPARLTACKGGRAINGIDDPETVLRRHVGCGFLGLPSGFRQSGPQAVHQNFIGGQISFGDRRAVLFRPAFIAGARQLKRTVACFFQRVLQYGFKRLQR